MTEPIKITPEVLLEVADGHDEVVRHIETARERGGDISAAVESYGPIMHQFKAAVGDLLLDRDNALAEHATRHRNASDDLRKGANIYVSTDDHNAEQIGQVPNT
jgi:hypothetical protein